jgi:hypothetical protein
VFTWAEINHEVGDETKSHDPSTQKSVPEIVLNCSRVFDPHDEHVPGENNGYQEHECLPHQGIFQDHLKKMTFKTFSILANFVLC